MCSVKLKTSSDFVGNINILSGIIYHVIWYEDLIMCLEQICEWPYNQTFASQIERIGYSTPDMCNCMAIIYLLAVGPH